MLKRNFKADMCEDTSSDDDVSSLQPYRTKSGAKISGIHAIQIVYR